MKTSIALIGFMGVGKTVAGRVLAERLRKKLVEVDSLIAQRAGKTIPQIFREDGEIVFRELEIAVIKEVSAKSNQVIDCGGGVVLNKINIDRLKQSAVVFWLTASPEVISRRTRLDGDGRPLLSGKKSITEIEALLRYRRPFYEIAADVRIDTSELDLKTLVEKIIEQLKDNADFSF
jgi:shikimate kinase